MSSFGTVRLGDVWAMLKDCAPGHERELKKHRWWVTFRGRTFRGLSKGSHGNPRNPEIWFGAVQQMADFFEIQECARGHFPQLRIWVAG